MTRLTQRDLKLIADTRAALADGSARRQREAAGIRPGELAAVIGVTRQAVAQWESGKRVPGAENVLAYGRALRALAAKAA